MRNRKNAKQMIIIHLCAQPIFPPQKNCAENTLAYLQLHDYCKKSVKIVRKKYFVIDCILMHYTLKGQLKNVR